MSDTVRTMVQASNVDGRGPRIVPTGAALGARVEGLDLRGLDTETFACMYQAWLDHQVLLFRDQWLTDEDLLAFSRRFGDLDEAPVQESGRRFVEGHPEIYVVSNVVEDGVPRGSLGAGEAVWHTDMSYLPDPPKASALYAIEVPAQGGDSSFCSMSAAWAQLPDRLRPGQPERLPLLECLIRGGSRPQDGRGRWHERRLHRAA